MFHLNRRMILYLLLLLIGAFTVNAAIHGFQHANRMRQRPDEPIQAWMNIPYIGHSYHVPNAVIATAVGIDDKQRDGRPLQKIAAEKGVTTTVLIEQIEAAIKQFRASRPVPPGAPQPPVAPTPVPTPAASGSAT